MAAKWRSTRILWIVAALVLTLAILEALWVVSRARCFALVGEMICRVETDQPMVALTFDDGPTERGVAAALPHLRAGGARATFFLIGREVGERPHLVRRIVAEGHEIANHSLTHQVMIGRSSAFYDSEIAEAHRRLIAAGAPSPKLFRPPFGKKLWGLPASARRHGYRMVMIDVEEPTTEDPRAYAERLVREAKPGSILLMHLMYRSNDTAREALPLVIRGLQARGFRIVTVGELLAAGRRDRLPAASVRR
ncbi:MAG TPA: polysaccharide deacetylase family protein [Allosphingosinicella sp.]|jgi:peptidoglycan/xylan/chitin deacetylase (PgdA/CDA1 family)